MYHTVFYITDRYPDAIICVLAIASILPISLMGLRRSWRERFWMVSCLGLLWAALLWLGTFLHAVGTPQGLEFGVIGTVFALSLAWSIGKNSKLILRGGNELSARTLGPLLAAGALALTAAFGSPYLASFDLARQAAEGQGSVVEGAVHDVRSVPSGLGYKPGSECFSVASNQYCYTDFGSVGFHQTSDNGGPIREGLVVRVTSVGDVIVRLEILEQP